MSERQSGFVVLGAAGGVGREVCRRLIRAGGRVLLAGRTREKLSELAAELQSPFCTVEATSFEQVETVCQEAAERFGRVDGVVNCVGSILLKPAHLTTRAELDETLTSNLVSAFAAVRAGQAVMKRSGGAIVLVASAAAEIGLANHEAIAAAKGGVAALARSAAASYAARGIRVNAVAPGLVKTPLTERIWGHERAAEASRAMHPLGRLGEPDDVAALIAWLLSSDAGWVTGQVFAVDGGLARLKTTPRSG